MEQIKCKIHKFLENTNRNVISIHFDKYKHKSARLLINGQYGFTGKLVVLDQNLVNKAKY